MSFDVINLDGLPIPDVLETISFAEIFEAVKADFKTLYEERVATEDLDLPDFDTLMIESEPVVLALRTFATREMLLRQRVNDAAKAVMLRSSWGNNLQNLAAAFGVERLPGESDKRLRTRITLAPGAYSVAGPIDAYRFFAMTAAPETVHVAAFVSGTGDARRMNVVPLTAEGAVEDATLERIRTALDGETVLPATDIVVVRRPFLRLYGVEAELLIAHGADQQLIVAKAEEALIDFDRERRETGKTVFRSALIKTLSVAGVDDVVLHRPAADIICGRDEAALLDHGDIALSIREVAP